MNSQQAEQTSKKSIPIRLVITRLGLMIVFVFAVLFISAGRLDWWEAWAYIANTLIVIIISRGIMLIKNPDMAMERAEASRRENVLPVDRILVPIVATYGPLVTLVVAGLDKRFGWSPDLPDSVQIIALLVIFTGSMIGSWAMIANRFFSSHIRIQTDRGHKVIDSGPYRIVRHPGYASGLLSWLACPVFFSSYWVAIPTLLVIIAMVFRTSIEDRTLQDKLPGYRDYTQSTRYRLIPGIW